MFLAKRFQFGFALPSHKLSALTSGDLSGTVVHPVLVHVCHLWGYMLDYYERNGTWTYAPDENGDEVAQMRLILGGLAGMLGPAPNPVTAVMTYLSVSLYFFHKSDFSRGQEFLTVAGDTVLKNDLDLAALANVPEGKGAFSIHPLDDAGELRSVFSHLIYTATAAEVVLTAPTMIDIRLLDKFYLLMVCGGFLSPLNPIDTSLEYSSRPQRRYQLHESQKCSLVDTESPINRDMEQRSVYTAILSSIADLQLKEALLRLGLNITGN